MAARHRSHESGFSLIELLVVVLILGVLAAIALPVFLNQRQKAVDASLKSDLSAVAVAVESWANEYQTVPTEPQFEAEVRPGVTLSSGDSVAYVRDGAGYCLLATRAPGAAPASHPWAYRSLANGLQPGTVTTC